jgi:hypothetical protein
MSTRMVSVANRDDGDEETLEVDVFGGTGDDDQETPPRKEAEASEYDGDADDDDDEVADYSERVQKRIKKLTWEREEERRAAQRARQTEEEAIRFAQQAQEENRRLQRILADGEKTLSESSKQHAEAELEAARGAYASAFESGDTEAITEAQVRMSKAVAALDKWSNYRPQYQTPDSSNGAHRQQAPQQQPRHVPTDPKAEVWRKNNPWFGTDDEMTGYAMGLHTKLVRSGIHPQSEEYYQRIDQGVRKFFPDHIRHYFPDKYGDVESDLVSSRRQHRQPGNVVAPVTRSTKKPRKAVLTPSQLKLAKRLKLTPQQYAEEMMKVEAADD